MYLCRYSPVYDLKTICRLRLDMAESSESLLMLFWRLNESEGSQLQSRCTIRLIWCRMASSADSIVRFFVPCYSVFSVSERGLPLSNPKMCLAFSGVTTGLPVSCSRRRRALWQRCRHGGQCPCGRRKWLDSVLRKFLWWRVRQAYSTPVPCWSCCRGGFLFSAL